MLKANNRVSGHALTWVTWLAVSNVTLAATASADAALIVQNDSASATIQALDPLEAEQERLRQLLENKPKAYQDKVMHTGALPLSTSDTPTDADEPNGFRSYSLESRVGFNESQATNVNKQQSSEAGVRAEYHFETENYGEMIGQVDTRTQKSATENANELQNVRVTARNLGLPLTSETLADTSVGDINSEVTDAFGRSYRLSLGTSPVRGAGTHVYNATSDFRAGSGKRGELVGAPYPGFATKQGELSWLGYTHKLSDKVTAGVQVNQAQDLSATTQKVRSVAASAKYGQAARVTLVQSQTDSVEGQTQDANGVFVESSIRDGRYQHELGAYDAEPDLRFGDNRLGANSRGAYWRVDHQDTRLNLGGGVDVEQDSTTGNAQRVSVDSNAHYRVDARQSLGGTLHLSDTSAANEDSRSVRGSAFYQTQTKDWGRSRLNATVHRNETLVANGVAATGDELQWEQDWVTGKYETMRPELTTTLGVAHDRSGTSQQTYPTASVTARQWVDADWNVGGNLRYSSRTGNLSTSQGLSGTLSSEYVLGKEWHVGASASINEARVDVENSTFAAPQVSRSSDKTAYVYVGWQGSKGTAYPSIGARQQGMTGTGSIAGTVFFDANRDGEQQAAENGVPGVEVLLDGRYRTTTDNLGEFTFAQVATGSHPLTLNLDSIPLPWGASLDKDLSVDVPLRGQVSARIPVVQVGSDSAVNPMTQ